VDPEWQRVDPEKFREAVRAIQARSLGRDPVAVRTALEAELADRGLTDADPGLIERTTRMLVAVQGPFASFRVTREMSKLFAETVTALRALGDGTEVPAWLEPPPGQEVGVRTKANPDGPGEIFEVAEVDLADGIQPFLVKAFDAAFDPDWDDEEQAHCKVWIDTRRAPTSGAPLPIILGEKPIGTLDGEDALTLDRDLHKAEKRKQPLILDATIERDQGSLSVWVLVP
jgi:hypothetical protein